MTQSQDTAPTPSIPESGRAWRGTSVGTWIVATFSCGCAVKVRDAAAAERMSQVPCREHATALPG